jgi:hypothetical protein
MYKKTGYDNVMIERADEGHLDEMGTRLRAAVPHLIVTCRSKNTIEYEHESPFIREVDPGWDELSDEGYDPDGSPLGPVYWRIVKRAEQILNLSTFPVRRDDVVRIWGPKGLAFCDPKTGIAVARLENVLEDSNNAE